MLFTPSDFSNGIKCLQKMCEMPQLHRHNYGIPQWNIFDPTHPRRNVESIRAFPGWIRTRIGCVGGSVQWECGSLWNACLAMPGALGSTLDIATKKRQSREVAGEKKTRAMELSAVQN